jgi:hypothetical protein
VWILTCGFSAEFVVCGTDRAALLLNVLVLNLLCVAQTEQHYSCFISADFVMSDRDRAALQLYILVLNLL